MTTIWIITAVMLIAAASITMFRILAGPSTLDRLVALDTLVAVTMCGIGAWAAFSLDTTVTYSLTALALISFVGSVSVARFRVPDTDKRRVERSAVNAFDIVTAVLVLGGSTLVLTGAIGVVGFPTPCRGCTRRPSLRCWACCWCWPAPRSGCAETPMSA